MDPKQNKISERSVSKGLKREARNCQQRGAKIAQHPRGTAWMKKKSQKNMVAYISGRYTESRDKQSYTGSQPSLKARGVF